MDPVEQLRPGDRLGPYEVLSMIGAGGMGQVYRARDPRLQREVAIKVLPDSFVGDPERARRFQSEALAAGALNHPNILTVFDVGTEGRIPYLVSELLTGEMLRDVIARGKMPISRTVDYIRQAAQGLSAAHAAGIVHRDIKPENLFITRDRRLKILDFGLAKAYAPKNVDSDAITRTIATDAGIVVGTAAYMSPEQIQASAVDQRSDIFSLGCVLYEALGGKQPFTGKSAIQTMNAIVHEEPPDLQTINPDVPRGLVKIVSRCLEKNPDERFQSAKGLDFALDAVSELAQSQSVARPAPPRSRASRIWRGAVVAATIAAIAAGGIFVANRGRQSRDLTFRRLTFRRGRVHVTRFTPDAQGVVFSAAWEGEPSEVFELRFDARGARALNYRGYELRSVSPGGELALLGDAHTVNNSFAPQGKLALAPLSGGMPREVDEGIDFLDTSPDGRANAVVRETSSGIQLEYPAGNVLYRTGGYIGDPRISPDGDLIAFLDHPIAFDNGGAVMVVDRKGQRRTLSADLTAAEGLAWSPGGKEIWFTASRKGNRCDLRAVTLTGKERVLHSQSVNMLLHDVSRDGRALIGNDDGRTRIVGRVAGETSDRDLSWLDWSLVSGVSPDGKQIAFFESGEGAGSQAVSYFRSMDGGSPTLLGTGRFPGFSADGRLIAVSNGSQVLIYPVGIGQVRTVSLRGFTVDHAGVLADNRRIWFSGTRQGVGRRIYVAPMDGSQPPSPISPEGITVSGLATDPESRHVIGYLNNVPQFFPVDGGSPEFIRGVEPGERVAYAAKGLAYVYVYRRNAAPSQVVRVWRADGRREELFALQPADRAGLVNGISSLQAQEGGGSYTYSYMQRLSELHVLEGLR